MSTTIEITMSLLLDSFSWRIESEWEEEVVDLLELGTEVNNLIDNILNAFDSVFTKTLLDDLILNKRNSLSVEFSESSLIDKRLDGTLGWESISNIWLDMSKHIHRGFVILDKDSITDLGKSE